jgi:site-specific DNA-methyltransferase (cytosine-N4-specific)
MQSKRSIMENTERIENQSWDFRGVDTKYNNHGLHSYPAMMIPQIAKRLIETYGKNAKVLLDPFMGSGTALLEAKLHKNFEEAYGIDINPLSILVAKVKTTPLDLDILQKEYLKLINKTFKDKNEILSKKTQIETPDFFNIDFWFKPKVKMDLSILKKNIDDIKIDHADEITNDVKDFFYITFSEIIRKVSNTRNGEYKLYRIKDEALEKHNPDTLLEFEKRVKYNIKKMKEFNRDCKKECEVKILAEDTRKRTSIPDNHVDIVVTSPPYGDSRTTVAYGQFSRLSLQWLGFDKKVASSVDKKSLGGVPSKDLKNDLNSPSLTKVIDLIAKIDEKRARDVLSFYKDFYKCIIELDRVMKKEGFLCFVVGNRNVKGVRIPTDKIIVELFKMKNKTYKHHKTIIRNIPNKRLPKKNSPTNVKGKKIATMNKEYIVILQK